MKIQYQISIILHIYIIYIHTLSTNIEKKDTQKNMGILVVLIYTKKMTGLRSMGPNGPIIAHGFHKKSHVQLCIFAHGRIVQGRMRSAHPIALHMHFHMLDI
jgi:hypothetical protein